MEHIISIILLCIVNIALVGAIFKRNNSCTLYEDMLQCENHIPRTIPDGVKKVDLVNVPVGIPITSYLFSGKGWDNITFLAVKSYSVAENVILKADCFRTLNSLDELHIHLLSPLLDTNVFRGLRNLKLLDLSNSTGLYQKNFAKVFVPSSLPKLRKLVLARLGLTSGYNLNENFFKQIEAAKISYIDVSYLQANTLNATAMANHCKYLRTIIARGTFIGTIFQYTNLTQGSFDFEMLDVSKIQTPGIGLECFIHNVSDRKDVVLNLDKWKLFLTVPELYFDSFCETVVPGILHNFTNIRNISFESKFSWNIQSLSMNNNGFAHVDITLAVRYSNLKWLSASDNFMEYLNPDFLLSFYSLRYLDLSRNRLEIMHRQNAQQFKVLLKPLPDLRYIILSANGLSSIPKGLFDKNSNIETIDLSGNQLQQIHLEGQHYKNLKLLNISSNTISVLDQRSQRCLAFLLQFTHAKVDMSNNKPLCCECSHLGSITWLVHHRYDIFDGESMKCLNKDGKYVILNEKTIEDVQSICQRRRNIIISSTAGCLCLSLAVIWILLTRRHLKRKRKATRLTDTFRKFVEQEPGHEFVAFLSFSTDDQNTVLRFILPQLEQKLQETIGVDRDLICLGDKHFRVGYPIYNETMRCLNISCVVLFIVSESFCLSEYCKNEFLQAYEMRKPIILMMKEECNEDIMPPILKELFLKNTRIIWLNNDNGFALKTTWENICRSVIDLCVGSI